MIKIYKFNKDIEINVGADFQDKFRLLLGGTDSPRDITGWTFSGNIKASFTGAEIVALSCSIVNATDGQFKIALTDAQTSSLATSLESNKRKALQGVFTVDGVDTAGDRHRILEGRVYLSRTTL